MNNQITIKCWVRETPSNHTLNYNDIKSWAIIPNDFNDFAPYIRIHDKKGNYIFYNRWDEAEKSNNGDLPMVKEAAFSRLLNWLEEGEQQ